jgi:hypothetical protein
MADLSNATAFFINSSEMHSGFDQGNKDCNVTDMFIAELNTGPASQIQAPQGTSRQFSSASISRSLTDQIILQGSPAQSGLMRRSCLVRQ